MRRLLAPIAALACIAALVALYQLARRYDTATPAGGGPVADVAIRLEGATIVARAAGQEQWRIRADRVDIRRAPGEELEALAAVELTGLNDGVLLRRGRPEVTFSARSATYSRASGRLDVRGGIRVRSARGDTLRTDHLLWSESDDFIRLPEGGRGTFDGNRVTAPSLLYSPRRRLVQCPQGAEALFQGYPLRVEQMHLDLASQVVWCPGRVTGERRRVRFAAQDVRLDLRRRHLTANAGEAAIRMEGEDLEVGGW